MHYGFVFELDIVIYDFGVNDMLFLIFDFLDPDHEVNRFLEWAVNTRFVLEYSVIYCLICLFFSTLLDAEIMG